MILRDGGLVGKSFKWSALALFVAAGMGLAGSASATPISGQGTWETELQARDINGNPVALDDASAAFYYDLTLNITWLRDWNASNSSMTRDVAVAWASGLTVGSFSGWRLPTITDYGNDGCTNADYTLGGGPGTDCGYNIDTSGSELAHMWYVTLGNLAYCPPGNATCNPFPQPGWGLTNTAYFTNMQTPRCCWTGTAYAPDPSDSWYFAINDGYQYGPTGRDVPLQAVAVRPGDVAAVPEPATFTLLGLGLMGLGFSRRLARAWQKH